MPTISADSPSAAIAAAQSHPATARWLRMLEDPQGIGEFAEEFTHDLVDVVGDAEFKHSRWFHAAETPLLQILRRLIRWEEADRTTEEMRDRLQKVRRLLSQSI